MFEFLNKYNRNNNNNKNNNKTYNYNNKNYINNYNNNTIIIKIIEINSTSQNASRRITCWSDKNDGKLTAAY